MDNNFIELLTHPQIRELIIDKLHHGTTCMISMTCKELLRLHIGSLMVQLKPETQMDGECIGNVSMIQYTNLSINSKLTRTLTATGKITALSYCFNTGKVKKSKKLTNIAASNGQIETLKYLYKNGFPRNNRAPTFAATNGHIETLKYFYKIRLPPDKRSTVYAVINGQIETIKYLHKSGCPFEENLPETAAGNGQIEIFKYLRNNGY